MAHQTRAGLFLLLAGGLASVLHRYSQSSRTATLLISSLSAAVLAAIVVDFAPASNEAQNEAIEAARESYVKALDLDLKGIGGAAEGRGPGTFIVWFHIPPEELGECHSYPAPEVREHLRELGFERIVIANQASSTGVCSFEP